MLGLKLMMMIVLVVITHVDTEVKLRHVIRYIDMHIGTIEFELGLIAGLMINRFRLMLRLYRMSSDLSYYQKAKIDWQWENDFAYAQRMLVGTSSFLTILALKNEFLSAVDKYMGKMMRIKKIVDKCKKDKICRRSNDLPTNIGQTASTKPSELEADYFGHMVPKLSKVSKGPDRVEQLFQLEDQSMKYVPYEKLPKVHVPHDKFEKINDWLRYLANGGMEKNKLLINDIEGDEFYELTNTELLPTTPMRKSVRKMRRFTPHAGRKDHEVEQLKSSKKPRIPWGQRGSDYELKKQARDRYRERMRAGFDPKREGIHIELPDNY